MVLLTVARWPLSRQRRGMKACALSGRREREPGPFGMEHIFLIWDNPGVPSVRQPLTNEQGSDHLKWFSWLCWLQEVFSMVLQRAWWNKIYLQLAF